LHSVCAYFGKEKIENNGVLKWYYYEKSSTGKAGTCKLDYDKNKVMYAARQGDVIVFAKNHNDEMALVVVPPDSKHIDELYKILKLEQRDGKVTGKTSLWSRVSSIWRSSDSEFDEAQIAEEIQIAKDMRISDFDETGYDVVDMKLLRDKNSQQLFVIGNVVRIVDGDTIYIDNMFKVRMVGIDAPERGQKCTDKKGNEYACGKASTANLEKVIGKRMRVKCEMQGWDRYGRHLFICEKSDGTDINAQMVKDGHAVVSTYPPIVYSKEEAAAREKKAGIWSGEFQHPHCYRHKKKKDWNKAICETKEFWRVYHK
jgi:endonuclease YncB( thermonuclease family)